MPLDVDPKYYDYLAQMGVMPRSPGVTPGVALTGPSRMPAAPAVSMGAEDPLAMLQRAVARYSQDIPSVAEMRGTQITNPMEEARQRSLDYYLQQMVAFKQIQAQQIAADAQKMRAQVEADQLLMMKDPAFARTRYLMDPGATIEEANKRFPVSGTDMNAQTVSPGTPLGVFIKDIAPGGFSAGQSLGTSASQAVAADPGLASDPQKLAQVHEAMFPFNPTQTTPGYFGATSPAMVNYRQQTLGRYDPALYSRVRSEGLKKQQEEANLRAVDPAGIKLYRNALATQAAMPRVFLGAQPPTRPPLSEARRLQFSQWDDPSQLSTLLGAR